MSSEWRLAFEQHSDLTTVSGSAAAVADAVRRGADLRLYMTTSTYEETLYFQQTACDRWRLAYEHDEQGNRVAGSLDDLMEAAPGWPIHSCRSAAAVRAQPG